MKDRFAYTVISSFLLGIAALCLSMAFLNPGGYNSTWQCVGQAWGGCFALYMGLAPWSKAR